MVVENPKNRIDGSAALAPEVKPLPGKKIQNPKISEKEKEALKKARKNKFFNFLKLNGTILAAGIMGAVIVGRYSTIYGNQKQINELEDQIHAVNESTEDLNIKLLQFNNIAYIEQTAVEKLQMSQPSTTSAVYCDLDGKSFINPDAEKTEASQDILSKIKELLFN